MKIPFTNANSLIWNKIVDWLIREAKKTPYSHITETRCIQHWELNDPRFTGSCETVYMERYWLWGLNYYSWLMRWFGISVRLHWIRRPDIHRHLHDHPWPFASLVLRGSYTELLPLYPYTYCDPHGELSGLLRREGAVEEFCEQLERPTGSLGFRRPQDRHAVSYVSPGGVWTLFISGKKKQWWGFFVKLNGLLVKVYHSDYARYLETQGASRPTLDRVTDRSKQNGVDFV